MNRDCLDTLFQRIIHSVGESKFISEAYIDTFLKDTNSMYNVNYKTTGGYILGQVKLAIALRGLLVVIHIIYL